MALEAVLSEAAASMRDSAHCMRVTAAGLRQAAAGLALPVVLINRAELLEANAGQLEASALQLEALLIALTWIDPRARSSAQQIPQVDGQPFLQCNGAAPAGDAGSEQNKAGPWLARVTATASRHRAGILHSLWLTGIKMVAVRHRIHDHRHARSRAL